VPDDAHQILGEAQPLRSAGLDERFRSEIRMLSDELTRRDTGSGTTRSTSGRLSLFCHGVQNFIVTMPRVVCI
jgi:hypothetical protein